MKRLLGALLGAVILTACSEAPAALEETVSADPEVTTTTVTRKSHGASVRLTGTIESRHDAVISAEVPGRVVGRPAPEGTVVAAGAPVILLEETAHRLQRDLARVAARESALHPDIPAADRASAELRLELAQDRLDRCRITAPADATVEALHVEVGEWVNVGTPVARLIDYDALELRVHVGEDVAVRCRIGTTVDFTVDAYGPQIFTAAVSRIGRAADDMTGKFEIELHVEASPRPLFVGMFARADLDVDGSAEIIRLPKKVVRRRFGEEFCFVLAKEDDGFAARERRLRVAPIVGDLAHVEVLDGLAPGDEVITGPFTGLRDGVRVRVGGSRR